MFERFINLVNEDNFKKIEKLNILIIGVGGVGSYAFMSLVRSGIKNITIIDNDIIDKTNINRQIMANNKTIGKKKVKVLKKEAKKINQKTNITIIDDLLNQNNIDLINTSFDYVIDACDNINAKIEIIKRCHKLNIKFISAMATCNKTDSNLFKICDIRKTSYDPLAKKIRKILKENNIKKEVLCISSPQIPIKTNKLGSNSYIPSSVGLKLTEYIINKEINY